MSQQFSNTGIQDGLTVEASQVSQSVDAFSGAKAYDIVLSGSLEVSGSTPASSQPGSIRFTGSLVNDGPGQFSHLGINVANPPGNNIALHVVSDIIGGFDPVMKIEGEDGNDLASIRLANEDITWDVRLGQPDDQFQIGQNVNPNQTGPNINLYPFVSDKDVVDYTLFTTKSPTVSQPGNISIGIGANSETEINNLNYSNKFGIVRANNYVTSSLFRAGILSASKAGENIHGTASWSSYIETAQTASYVKATDIDFSYQFSGGTNPNGNADINAIKFSNISTGSIVHAIVDTNVSPIDGIYSGNTTDGYYVAFSGSLDDRFYIGNPTFGVNPGTGGSSGGNLIEFNVNNYIKLGLDQIPTNPNASIPPTTIFGEQTFADQHDLYVKGDLKVSGSGNNTASMDGFDPGDFVPFASASFRDNSLQFNVNNVGATTQPIVHLMNKSTGNASRLSFSAGGGGSDTNFTAFRVSASKDTQIMQGSYNYGIMGKPADDADVRFTHAYQTLGRISPGDNGAEKKFILKNITSPTNESFFGNIIFQAHGNNGGTQLPSELGVPNSDYMVHFDFEVIGCPSNGNGVFIRKEFVWRYILATNSWTPIANPGIGSGNNVRLGTNGAFALAEIYNFGVGQDTVTFYLQTWNALTANFEIYLTTKVHPIASSL